MLYLFRCIFQSRRKNILKKIIALLPLLCCLLAGCQSKEAKELEEYRSAMTAFYDGMTALGAQLGEISPESAEAAGEAADVIGQMAGQCEEAAALAAPESYEDVPGSLSLAAQELRSASDGYREAFAAQYLDEAVLSDAQQHYANADTALRSALSLLRGGDEAEE